MTLPNDAGRNEAVVEQPEALSEAIEVLEKSSEHSTPIETNIDALPVLGNVDPSIDSSRKWAEYKQFAALCFCLFTAGWNDGTIGPLLNRIKAVYHVIPFVSSLGVTR